MEKQRLLYQQSRLHNRGAAEMVLQMISACKGSWNPRVIQTLLLQQSFTSSFEIDTILLLHVGETGPMVTTTLKLGISILNGGNSEVQRVCSQSIKALAMNQMTVTKLNLISSSPLLPENAGVPEGQEGRGLLLESPGTDADLLVSSACLICLVIV